MLTGLLMLRLQLPLRQYDLFVYVFQYGFSGFVGGYGVCVYILYGHRAISFRAFGGRQNRRDTVRRSYGNRAVIVQSPQPRTEITRIS